MSRTRVAAGALALACALTGCVSTNEVGGSDNATPTTTTIPPVVGVIGQDIEDDGVKVTVVDIAAFDQSPHDVPRIEVTMRAENVSRVVQANPDVTLLCSETTNTGDWFLGSTWEPNVALPVNAVTEGTVIVGFPLKGDNPEYPVVTCSAPRLRVIISATSSDVVDTVEFPIDESVIREATRRPRGPNLPLPYNS